MKAYVIAAVFSVVSITSVPAFAQTMALKTAPPSTLTPAEETMMHEDIVHEHHAAVTSPPGFVVTTGAAVPSTVELYSFPAERHWGYEYAIISDQVVLVDPATRRVVHILH